MMYWSLFFSLLVFLIYSELTPQITLPALKLFARILSVDFRATRLVKQSYFLNKTASLIAFPGIPMLVWSLVYWERFDIGFLFIDWCFLPFKENLGLVYILSTSLLYQKFNPNDCLNFDPWWVKFVALYCWGTFHWIPHYFLKELPQWSSYYFIILIVFIHHSQQMVSLTCRHFHEGYFISLIISLFSYSKVFPQLYYHIFPFLITFPLKLPWFRLTVLQLTNIDQDKVIHIPPVGHFLSCL